MALVLVEEARPVKLEGKTKQAEHSAPKTIGAISTHECEDYHIRNLKQLLGLVNVEYNKITMYEIKTSGILPDPEFIVRAKNLELNLDKHPWANYVKLFEPTMIREIKIVTQLEITEFLKNFVEYFSSLNKITIESPKITFTIHQVCPSLSVFLYNTGNEKGELFYAEPPDSLSKKISEPCLRMELLEMNKMRFSGLPSAISLHVRNCEASEKQPCLQDIANLTSINSFERVGIISENLKGVTINCTTKIVSNSSFDIVVESNNPESIFDVFSESNCNCVPEPAYAGVQYIDLSESPNIKNITHNCWTEVEYTLSERCEALFISTALIPPSAFPNRNGSNFKMRYKVNGGSELEYYGSFSHGNANIKYYNPRETVWNGRDLFESRDEHKTPKYQASLYGGRISADVPEEEVKQIAINYYPCPKSLRSQFWNCGYEDMDDMLYDYSIPIREWTWKNNMYKWSKLLSA